MRSRKGRTRSIREVWFDNFPEGDALWWVQWFDYDGPGSGTTGSAKIRVSFSKLESHVRVDALPVLDAKLVARRADKCSARLEAGCLPLISIGLVVRGSRVVGQLGATLRRFVFSAETHREHLENLVSRPVPVTARTGRARVPVPAPDAIPRGTMPGLLSQSVYPLENVEAGQLLSIRSGRRGTEHLVLPCPEVFRAAYAPHRMLALALLGGPWETTITKVLDRELTQVVDDGLNSLIWQVKAVEGIGQEHLTIAANLWLSAQGRHVANRLWGDIYGSEELKASISARLPFAWDVLEIEAAVIAYPAREYKPDPYWFGYAITSIRWPDAPLGPPSRIEWIPPDQSSKAPVDPSLPTIPGGVREPSSDEPRLTQDVPPSSGSSIVDIDADGADWSNAPELVRIPPRTREPTGPGRKRGSQEDEAEYLSAGATARGRTGAGTAQARAVDRFGGSGEACNRFDLVVKLLNGLAAEGVLPSHCEVTPPREHASARASLSVWAFQEIPIVTGKGRERWYIRDFAKTARSGIEVRRTAMVRSIPMPDRLLHLIEIEPRNVDDHYHSLLFVHAGTLRLEAVVLRLLQAVVKTRGNWSRALASMTPSREAMGVGPTALWRHATLIDHGKDAGASRLLDQTKLLSKIGSLAALDK